MVKIINKWEEIAANMIAASALMQGIALEGKRIATERSPDPIVWDVTHGFYQAALEEYRATTAQLMYQRDHKELFHLSRRGLDALAQNNTLLGLELRTEFLLGQAEAFARTDYSIERGTLMFSHYFSALTNALSVNDDKSIHHILTQLVTGASSKHMHPLTKSQYQIALSLQPIEAQEAIKALLQKYIAWAEQHPHLKEQVAQSKEVYKL